MLARSGRSSCAPPPGPRALCEVGLAGLAQFFYGVAWSEFSVGLSDAILQFFV
jgi:hypothetical protein